MQNIAIFNQIVMFNQIELTLLMLLDRGVRERFRVRICDWNIKRER